jgi:hypothetical protein
VACRPRKHGGTGLRPRRRLQTAAPKLGEVARRVQHRVATPMAVPVERGEGRRGGNGGAGSELGARPWRAALWCARAARTGAGRAMQGCSGVHILMAGARGTRQRPAEGA